jgi:hypothetical protein
MKGLVRWVWAGVVLGVLAVLGYAQLQGGGGSPLSPEILGVDLRPTIPADGSKAFGAVRFRDADGDVVQARFDVVEAVDFAPFSFNPKIKGQTSGSFPFFVFSKIPQRVRLRLTLIDEAGNQSIPVEFSFEAVMLIEVLGKWGTRGAGEAQFNGVSHIALDDRRRVYVTDFGLDRVQKFTSDGQLLAQWGGRGSGNGQFTGPLGIAVDYQGNVYVADAGNQRVQKFTESGAFITKWGSLGTGEGQFSFPTGVATDPAGNVYVADKVNNRIQKFSPTGVLIARWGMFGQAEAQFNSPNDIAVSNQGGGGGGGGGGGSSMCSTPATGGFRNLWLMGRIWGNGGLQGIARGNSKPLGGSP